MSNNKLSGFKSYQAFLKSPFRSLKHSTYFAVYDNVFKDFVGKQITVVEIGVLQGGSLFMWKELFGDNARIIGIDFNPNALKWQDYGFEIYIGDQSDEKFWNTFFKETGSIDLLIDDGGHTYDQQIITVECCIPFINEGGKIIVEDTHTSYLVGFGRKKYSFHNYMFSMVNLLNDRFSKFQKFTNSKKEIIWNIQFYESIVVLEINRLLCSTTSYEIENQGVKDNNALDFRFKNLNTLQLLEKNKNRLNLIKNLIPSGFKKMILRFFAYKEFKSKKYFKELNT